MGWEKRNGRRYYYRKIRDGHQVISEYIGRGNLAHQLASFDLECQSLELQRRENVKIERREFEEVDREINEFSSVVNDFVKAFLVTQGFHTHKGEWRKQRKKS